MKLLGNNNHGNGNSGTLAAQIEETEHQLVQRQHYVQIHADTFIRDLRREMASPTTLLLASEFGFILGELTKRPSPHAGPAAKKEADGGSTSHEEISPLKEALDIGSLVTTLYQALPLALIMDTFHPQDAPQAGSSAAAVKNTKAKVDLTKK
jgi:hypothetical protein